MRQPRFSTSWVLCFAALVCATPRADAGPTIVIDFKALGSAPTVAITKDKVGEFDAAAFGFTTTEMRATLIDSVMTALRSAFYDIPTADLDSRSPIPRGKMLDIDFVTGTIGQAPFAGATDYYFVQVGTGFSDNPYAGSLGVAGVSAVRNANGVRDPYRYGAGAIVASVFTDTIQGMGGLNPANALRSGNLVYSTNAIVGTLAHEIGHTLSLAHEKAIGAVTPNGGAPIMGTGATGYNLPNQARIGLREFTYSSVDGNNKELNHIAQLVGALGLRDNPNAIPEPAALAQAGTALALAATALLARRRRAAA